MKKFGNAAGEGKAAAGYAEERGASAHPGEGPAVRPMRKRALRPVRLLVGLALSAFIVEVLVMLLISVLPGMSILAEALVDALLLTALIFPFLYFFAFRPLYVHIGKREAKEEELAKAAAYIDALGDALIVLDMQRKVIRLNKAAERLLGYTHEERPGLTFEDIFPEREHERHYGEMKRAVETGTVRPLETAVVAKGGREVPVLLSGTAMKDGRGRPVCFIGVLRDITERKRAAEELTATKARLEHLLVTSPAVIYSCAAAGDYAPTFISKNVKRQLGYESEEFISDPGFWADHIHPQDAPRVFAELPSVLEHGSHTHEYRFQHKDGSYRWMHDEMVLVRDVEGNPLEIIGSWMDITERTRAEQAVKDSEQRFRTLFEHMTDGILLADAETNRFHGGNKAICRMLGYSLEELRTLGVEDIHPREDLPRVVEQIEKQISGELSLANDIRVKRKDGSIFYADVNAQPVVLDGRTYLMGMFRDLTERKALEGKLLQSEKLASMGQLVAGVAHELNNPLTAIIGFAHILEMKSSGLDEDTRHKIGRIHLQARRVESIIANLISFGRERPAEKAPVNVIYLLSQVLALKHHELDARGIKVMTDLDQEMPAVEADSQQMQQVFLNIINNAEHAMVENHGKGTLQISAYAKQGMAVIEFVDDGPGIPEEDLEKVFDPFFTTRDVGRGTGLGLSSSYGNVKEHGGNIFVESRDGRGARFVVELPVAEGEPSGGGRS